MASVDAFTKFFARVVKGIFSQIMNSDVLPVSLLPLSLCIVVPPTRTYRLGSRFHCAPPQHQREKERSTVDVTTQTLLSLLSVLQ